MDEITIEDFMKLDLRIAKIVSAESVEDADKLLRLELDVGSENSKTVFAIEGPINFPFHRSYSVFFFLQKK